MLWLPASMSSAMLLRPAEDVDAFPPRGSSGVLPPDLDQGFRPRLHSEIVAHGASDEVPVGVVDDEQSLVGQMLFCEPESVELLLVRVRRVVVVDAHRAAVQSVGPEDLECVTFEDLSTGQPKPRDVSLELRTRRIAHGKVVDRDKLLLFVAEHCGDEARSTKRPDLDIRLLARELLSREIE